MAPATKTSLRLTSRQSVRTILGMIGFVLLLAAMVSPWWTRGITVDWDTQGNPRPAGLGAEGFYLSYGPYTTPGSLAGFSTDAGRSADVAVLGIAMTLTILCVAAYNAVRILSAQGWLDTSPDVPVRFAITATLFGCFAVLWAFLFLPLLGPNPGWMFGTEGAVNAQSFGSAARFFETTRYANIGFFLGILGGIVYPALLWAESHTERRALEAVQADRAQAHPTLG